MILSHFVTSGHVIQAKQTRDKHEISTPKLYLLLQKGSKKKVRTTVLF